MLKYLRSFNYLMAYSETRKVLGGLALIPLIIVMAYFIKWKFGIKTKVEKDIVFKEEPGKIIEVKDCLLQEGKAEAIKKLSNKLAIIEQKADEVYEKVKKKRKIRRRKKNN